MTSSARIDDLQRKYEENPRRYFAPLASELRRAGEPRRAVALCEAGLAADPGHLSGHVVLGQALSDLGDPAGAERSFARAIELDPENLVALRSLGDLARDRGDRESARAWYQRALEADPRDPELATRLATLPDMPAQPPQPEGPPVDAPGAEVVEPRSMDSAGIAESEAPAVAQADVGRDDTRDDAPGDAEPGEGLLDYSMEREFQEQRDAQEFTAGFFAALLDAQDEARPAPAAATDIGAGAGFVDIADEANDHDAGEADAGGHDRPPEVTIADEPPDVRPEEAEFLDDLMEPHVEEPHVDEPHVEEPHVEEPHVEPHVEAAAAAELAVLSEPLAGAPAADAEPAHLAAPASDDEELLSVELDYVESGVGADAAAAPHVQSAEDSTIDGMQLEEPLVDETPAVDAAAEESAVAGTPVAAAHVGEPVVDETPAAETPSGDASLREQEKAGDETMAEEPSSASTVADDFPVEEETPHLPFVTATMGTLLLQQGFRSDALQIFRQLAAQQPDDADLRARVTELEAELAPPATESVGGPTVANWLRQLAGARPDTAEVAAPSAAGEELTGAVTAESTPAENLVVAPELHESHAGEPHAGEPGARSSAPDVASAEDEAGGREGGAVTTGATDLLASAAAAAASAVTWESTEVTPAADALFFGDDPLDWGQVGSPEASPSPAAPATPAAPAAESASELSLEELFGRPASSDDELAAGALAAATLAMQGDADVDAQLAEASAEDPTALEHVLSPTPPTVSATREGASFSFEQFFRPDAPLAQPTAADIQPAAESPAGETPAGHTGPVATNAADEAAAREADLADFHAWLAGLSKT